MAIGLPVPRGAVKACQRKIEMSSGAQSRDDTPIAGGHDRLEVHLRPIVSAGLVAHWDDRKLKPGSKWRDEIRLAIEVASIAILMISADYLTSVFILQNEVPS
jgi:hypothetical protein